MSTQSLTVKLGLTGLDGVTSGFKQLQTTAAKSVTTLSGSVVGLNQQAEGLNKFRSLMTQFAAEGSSGLARLTGHVSALGQSLHVLSGTVSNTTLGGIAGFAALAKGAELYFEGIAAKAEALSTRLGTLFSPGRDIVVRARGISSEDDRAKVTSDLDAEIERLSKRRNELVPLARNPLSGGWENANKELTQVLAQMSALGGLREKLTGTLGDETIRMNQLAQANKEATAWLKANGEATQRQIETLELSSSPLERQVELLGKQKRALEELYVNTSGASPMGERARLEIRRDVLELDRQIGDVESRIAQQQAQDTAESKRQVQEINAAWRQQVQELNRVGAELRRNAEVRLGIEASLREQVRGSTFAGNAADNYGSLTLSGMQEQASGSGGFGAGAVAGLQNTMASLGTTASQVGTAIQTSIGGVLAGIETSIQGLVMGTMRWADAFRNVGAAILSSVVSAFSRMIAEMAVSFALSKVFGSAMKAQAVSLGSAWTTAAISASIASYGTAASVGLAAFMSAQAAGQAASIGLSSATGFQEGGYTGGGGLGEIAGVVHRREFVMDAATVERVGVPQLQAIQDGVEPAAAASGSGGGSVNIATFDSRMDARRWASSQDAETWFVDMARRTAHKTR
ncbi:MAG: hypothetical protein J0M24_19770 [Verrucomicrobia bacterium]|nr:hypothetical protein [Verrucomicrobiota bacterium]